MSCSNIKLVFVPVGYFNSWLLELQKVKEENTRAQNLARILQKNKLGRILQAWRVVNQEECIIEPLLKRRVRRDMARYSICINQFFIVYDNRALVFCKELEQQRKVEKHSTT